MKSNYLHKISCIGILLISMFSYAQQPTINIKEQRNLEFQQHFFEALKQKAINNFSKAIESLEKCKLLDSASVAVDFEFSKNYFLSKKYFEAEIFIDKALKTAPTNKFLLLHKVAIYKAQQNFEKAIELQQELVKTYPNLSDDLVVLYIQHQSFNEAEQLISEIENKGLKSLKTISLKEYLANRKAKSKLDEKIIEIEDATIENLKNKFVSTKEYNVLLQLLNEELKQDLFDLLYEDSKVGLEYFPSQPFLYKMNAIALNKFEKYNETITVLTIGIDFVVDDIKMEADFYELFSKAYLGVGNKIESEKYRQKAILLRN